METLKIKLYNAKRNVLASVMIASMILFMPALSTAQLPATVNADKAGMTVNYLGDAGSLMLIEVDYKNAEGKKCNLTIFNGAGDVLYKQKFSTTEFNQKFKIQKTEELVKVVITDGEEKKTFEIANTTKVVQDVVVKKVK
jgi:hypothetical protein